MTDLPLRRSRSSERGSASIEYAVVSFAVIMALFVVPVGAGESMSALEFLLDALRKFHMHTTHMLSLP